MVLLIHISYSSIFDNYLYKLQPNNRPCSKMIEGDFALGEVINENISHRMYNHVTSRQLNYMNCIIATRPGIPMLMSYDFF